MTIKEKAVAYDEALDRAKKELDACGSQDCDAARQIFRLFPELKESEDKKMSEAILATIRQGIDTEKVLENNGVTYEDIETWLNNKTLKCSYEDDEIKKQLKAFIHSRTSLITQSKHDSWIAWLEKQGGQKSADNVKPKFKVGDWIVSNTVSKDYYICKITDVNIKDGNYTIESIYGYNGYNKFDVFDKTYGLWSLNDVKDGDVLSNGDMILIFKEFETPAYKQHIIAYIGLDNSGHIQVTDENWMLGIDKAKPATKEQRDTLFTKMKEAGYEWDSEKKKLKKIEQSSAEEYSFNVESELFQQLTKEQQGLWRKEIEQAYNAGAEAQKPSEWSRDDELAIEVLKNIIKKSEVIDSTIYTDSLKERLYDWLKSLRPQKQWKPSEEQIGVIEAIINNRSFQRRHLDSLYEQLKQL